MSPEHAGCPAKDAGARGFIFDIKRFALHDGPGIRTTVFLQGCPLRCLWCQNPESQPVGPRVFNSVGRCRACGTCVATCPAGAVVLEESGRRHSAERCRLCGACVRACPQQALALVGQSVTAEEVWQVVRRDRPFYANSHGGVTLSGGEPLMQPAFARAILRQCRLSGIHTALDTTAHAAWSALESLLPFTDLVLLDLKAMDPVRHRLLTGVDNRLILANATRLAACGVELVVRVPLIPGKNDDAENLQALAGFLARLPSAGRIDLLPYNRLAESKYTRFGLAYALGGLETPGAGRMAEIRDQVAASGWPVDVTWGLGVPAR